MQRRITFILLSIFIAFLPIQAQEDDHYFEVSKNLQVFNGLFKHLDILYVDTISPSTAIENAINGMLGKLDPYTEFYPASKSNELTEMLTGRFAGIGSVIRFNQKLKNVVIEEPSEGMPAVQAGLKKGDIIVAINDSSMAGKDVQYVTKRLRGEAGTSLKLTVRRPTTGKIINVNITRKLIEDQPVPFYGMLTDEVGYVKLTSFTEDCSKKVRRAIIELKEQGMKKLIFDLRENGGGAELEAVNTVNIFVDKDELIVSNRGKLPQVNRDYRTTMEPLDLQLPVVVLVDDGSASSSEIVAGSLQDLDRAVIMGQRTFGKGLVQIPIDLDYGSQMKVTASKYYIPSGRCIQAIDYRRSRSGYTGHVPDSLTKVFLTRNGREVRDGGGIKPDIEIMPDTMANISVYLSYSDSTEVMRDYVIDYIASHPTIAKPSEFQLSESDFAEFKQRVLASGFTYDRQSEKYIAELEKLIRFEGYYDDAREEIEALKGKLQHNVAKDLDYNRDEICRLIEGDIVSAYYYRKGVIEQYLRFDRQILAAIDLLNDTARYNSTLNRTE